MKLADSSGPPGPIVYHDKPRAYCSLRHGRYNAVMELFASFAATGTPLIYPEIW